MPGAGGENGQSHLLDQANIHPFVYEIELILLLHHDAFALVITLEQYDGIRIARSIANQIGQPVSLG